VVIASYLIDRALWGGWMPGYRLVNLVWHGLAAWLVWLLVRGLPGWCGVGAAVVALVAAWHPLAVEPVQSPAFREDLLAACGGLLFLVAAVRCPGAWWAGVTGLLGLGFGILSKESAAAYPVLLAVIWWYVPGGRPSRRVMARWLGGAGAVAAGLLAVILSGRPAQAVGSLWNGVSLPEGTGVWTAPGLFLRMIRHLVAPVGLSIEYPVTPVTGPFAVSFIAGMLVVALVLVWAWRGRSRGGRAALGALWMVVMFLPVSNLVPLINPFADRYAYLLLPGYALVVAGSAVRGGRAGRWVAMVYAVVLLGLTVQRIGDWKDDRTLWTAALVAEPQSAKAHTWLGLMAKQDGDRELARALFLRAEALNPRDPAPLINRAILLGEAGDLPGAEALLRAALVIRPDSQAARDNLAICLRLQGKTP
jgi:hypothetical protein